MEIGEPQREIFIDPIEDPVPRKRESPDEWPVLPEEPVREPEKVPAGV